MSSVAPVTSTNAREVPGADTLRGAARLFFRFPTPRILLAKLAVLGCVRAALGPPGLGDAAIVAGVVVVWPAMEWFLHKRLLHLGPLRVLGRTYHPVFARYHDYHHRHPWVIERTFLPTRVLVPLLPVNIALFSAVMPTWRLAVTGMTAMTAAALVYEWTHYLTHTPYRPRSAYYQRVHKNHMQHHFKDDARYFAFTAPWIDRALGTSDRG
jgi:hypothetical protein